MRRRLFSGVFLFGMAVLATFGSCGAARCAESAAEERVLPNVILFFIDDLGYADIGPFFGDEAATKGYATPALDKLASEGRIFTDFHVPQAVCSASRAALMTGCYPNRIGILGALFPTDTIGIADSEMTLGELFRQRGYATAVYGKWHLGCKPEFLPTRHGFDEYLGLPYSNDMWKVPYGKEWATLGSYPLKQWAGKTYADLPLIENETPKITDVTSEDQTQLTTWYTERAVQFIESNAGKKPFFVYIPHTMVHTPLFVSEKFRGKSERGLFGDVMMEIDWSVEQVMDALHRTGVADDTMVIFLSDNGPWLNFGNHAGSAGLLREGKGTQFEGGVRVPMVVRYPRAVPAGTVCRQPAMTIDLLPTFAAMIGATPPEHKIDGMNILPMFLDEKNADGSDPISPQEAYFFYWGNSLEAVRTGKWKLHFPHTYQTLSGRPGGTGGVPVNYDTARINLALFDQETDPGETTDLANEYPEIVAKMERMADRMREDLGDAARQMLGTGKREPGRLMDATS